MDNLRRLACGLEYDGTCYNGWQIQDHAPSIQANLNDAVTVVADEQVKCVGAGRTDTGVHAAGQVVHFDTQADRSPRSWLLGINSNLPEDINVLWVRDVGQAFHARFSALGRTYRYLILNRPVRSALHRHRAWWVREPLDVESMAAAAECLLGRHDFSSFRASACQSKSPVREMRRIDVRREGERVILEFEANAFLHHMVRNIVGSLARFGRGAADTAWFESLVDGRDRRLAGITAPAAGLCLVRIEYPADFDLPDT